jgi:hypothetical protein
MLRLADGEADRGQTGLFGDKQVVQPREGRTRFGGPARRGRLAFGSNHEHYGLREYR